MKRIRPILGFAIALVLVIVLAAPVAAASYNDIADHPYAASITALSERGIVSGYDDGSFRPDNYLQRQHFAKMVVLTMGYPVEASAVSPFKDTPAPYNPADPLYPGSYVAVAAEKGIILGKPDGTFDFAGNLTRQQAISIVVRAAGDALAEPSTEFQGKLQASYADPNHGANIKKAEFNGLLAGIPALENWDPAAYATRGEAAELLAKLLALKETQAFGPVVSTDWLAANLGLSGLVVLDIRPAEAYAAGHIPGAVNAPAGFYVNASPEYMVPGGDFMEVPGQDELFALLGSLGLTTQSKVVVVGGLGAPEAGIPATFGLADATRVADTLIYAGITDVAILDGAYPKWAAEGKPVTAEVPTVTPTTYSATLRADMWVTTDYVASKIGQAIIIDARDADVYSGERTEPWADKPGHIPSAVSLPAPLIWNETDWTYKSSSELAAIAAGAFTAQADQEIIVYCGVGGYESAWWFVLTQMLGYSNVKLYDGAAQEWVVEHEMVTESAPVAP